MLYVILILHHFIEFICLIGRCHRSSKFRSRPLILCLKLHNISSICYLAKKIICYFCSCYLSEPFLNGQQVISFAFTNKFYLRCFLVKFNDLMIEFDQKLYFEIRNSARAEIKTLNFVYRVFRINISSACSTELFLFLLYGSSSRPQHLSKNEEFIELSGKMWKLDQQCNNLSNTRF